MLTVPIDMACHGCLILGMRAHVLCAVSLLCLLPCILFRSARSLACCCLKTVLVILRGICLGPECSWPHAARHRLNIVCPRFPRFLDFRVQFLLACPDGHAEVSQAEAAGIGCLVQQRRLVVGGCWLQKGGSNSSFMGTGLLFLFSLSL